MRAVLETGEPRTVTRPYRVAGELRDFAIRILPRFDEDGDVVGLVGHATLVRDGGRARLAGPAGRGRRGAGRGRHPHGARRPHRELERRRPAPVGLRAGEALGQSATELLALDPGRRAGGLRCDHGGVPGPREGQDVRRDGGIVDIRFTASPISRADGTVEGIALIARDISRDKQTERRLRHRADHDPLTGLYTRLRFEEDLRREAATPPATRCPRPCCPSTSTA